MANIGVNGSGQAVGGPTISTEGGSKSQATITGPAQSQPSRKTYTFAEIEELSQSIGAWANGFPTQALHIERETASKVFAPLKDWLSSTESRCLWVDGPANTSRPSDVSMTAAHMISIVSDARCPKIIHHLQQNEPPVDILIRMTYSLLVQLVSLLPETFSSDKDFHSERFTILDRSVYTLPDALELLEDLLNVGPRVFVCVIDGIQMAEDDKQNDDGTGIFLNFFLDILKRAEGEKILKVLLTTDGLSTRLRNRLEPWEQVDVMNEAARGSSQRGKGRMSLDSLSMWEKSR